MKKEGELWQETNLLDEFKEQDNIIYFLGRS